MKREQPQPKGYVEDSGTAPPASLVVEHDHKPVLYLPNGKVLVRKAGF